MRNGPQQIGPEGLLPGGFFHLLFGADHGFFFQCQAACVEDGNHQILFKRSRFFFTVQRNSGNG